MAFGLNFLFDPLKALAGTAGTSLFGGPQAAAGALGGSATPASILSPAANKGLMHSGAEDLMGPAASPGGSLLRADEGPGGSRGFVIPPGDSDAANLPAGGASNVGLTLAAAPQPPSLVGGAPIVGHETPAPGPSTVATPAGPIVGGNTPIPPAQRPTEPLPGESSAPLQKPYQATPQTAPAPSAGGGSATPGATPTTRLPGQSGLDKMAEMGKALQGVGGAAAGKAAGFAPGGVGAPHSPDGAALMAKVMEASAPFQGAGPVPGMPPGLLQRFRR